MKQVKHNQRLSRSNIPRGIASQGPVPMRLSDEERQKLVALAAKEGRSLSSMARIVHLTGMVAIESELQAD
ncbi:hypothetical protein C6H68_20485 [Photorhabdus luminescens]|nr:hypothetical protein C6H68_20485 [Photorhabdus luminescens]